MRTGFFSALAIVVALSVTSSVAIAAPIESVESSRASAALQKVDAFLGEQLVADQLAALGLSKEQASARLAQLSDAQLEQLAAQVDMIKAGGTVQSGNPHPLGPLGFVFEQFVNLFKNFYALLFTWGEVK